MSSARPNLADPAFEPTEAEEEAILRAVARRVAWEKAMAARGVKVLALGLTPEQQTAAIAAWEREISQAGTTTGR